MSKQIRRRDQEPMVLHRLVREHRATGGECPPSQTAESRLVACMVVRDDEDGVEIAEARRGLAGDAAKNEQITHAFDG